jgi:hypothetical protein
VGFFANGGDDDEDDDDDDDDVGEYNFILNC